MCKYATKIASKSVRSDHATLHDHVQYISYPWRPDLSSRRLSPFLKDALSRSSVVPEAQVALVRLVLQASHNDRGILLDLGHPLALLAIAPDILNLGQEEQCDVRRDVRGLECHDGEDTVLIAGRLASEERLRYADVGDAVWSSAKPYSWKVLRRGDRRTHDEEHSEDGLFLCGTREVLSGQREDDGVWNHQYGHMQGGGGGETYSR